MPSPFAALGLAPGASLPEIKKAYARLLKTTRPDDDPIAFQQLRGAFEACLAQTAARQARDESRAQRTALAPAGMDGDDEGPDDDDFQPSAADDADEETVDPIALPRSRVARMAPPPPLRASAPPATPRERAPAVDEATLKRLLVEIMTEAERGSAYNLRKWLHAHDTLVSLDVQQLVAARLPQVMLDMQADIDTESFGVLFDYFMGGGFGPANADPRPRMAWELAHASEMQKRQLAALRRRRHTQLDRVAFDELLTPPSRWRRGFLLAIPGTVSRVIGLGLDIHDASQPPARPVLRDEAMAFWSSLGRPGRIPWRLLALVTVQTVVLSCLLFTGLALPQGLGLGESLMMASVGVAYAMAVWLVVKAVRIGRYWLAVFDARRESAGKFATDPLTLVGYVLSAAAVAGALAQQFTAGSGIGMIVAMCCMFGVMLLQIGAGRGRRFEMAFLSLTATAAAWGGGDRVFGASLTPPVLSALTFACGTVLPVLADRFHAYHENVAPAVARREVNHIALYLAIGCLVLCLGIAVV